MGLICTGGVRDKPILPEDPSSGNLFLTLYELDLTDSKEISPRSRTHTVCQRISAILREVPVNPLRIRDVARLLSNWTSWQKLLLMHHNILRIIVDIAVSHAQHENGKKRESKQYDVSPSHATDGEDSEPGTPRHVVPEHQGVGYATGSTSTQWNLKKAIDKKRRNQAVLIACLRAMRAMIAKLDVDAVDPQEPDRLIFEAISIDRSHISADMSRQLNRADLVQFLAQLLTNQSILDVSEQVELYTAVMQYFATVSLFVGLNYVLVRPQEFLEKSLSEHIGEFYATVKSFYKETNQNYTLADDRFIIFIKRMDSWYISIRTSLKYLLNHEMAEIAPNARLATASGDALQGAEARYVQLLSSSLLTIHKFVDAEQEFAVPYSYERDAWNIHPFSLGLASRMSRITKEIAALRNSLPINYYSSIFVAIDETRSDIVKVLITGPRDTPYEDGCFELDVFFPKNYPANPPKARLATTGNGTVRFNPNLYNDGKICLSILNTWEGRPEERWNPSFSLLQVLVSIQALIFVPEPYFNEPGFERVRGTIHAQQESTAYNARLRLATIQHAMLDHLLRPPTYFEHIIRVHFWLKRDQIIHNVKEWSTQVNFVGDLCPDYPAEQQLDAVPVSRTHLEEKIAELETRLNQLKPPDDDVLNAE